MNDRDEKNLEQLKQTAGPRKREAIPKELLFTLKCTLDDESVKRTVELRAYSKHIRAYTKHPNRFFYEIWIDGEHIMTSREGELEDPELPRRVGHDVMKKHVKELMDKVWPNLKYEHAQ